MEFKISQIITAQLMDLQTQLSWGCVFNMMDFLKNNPRFVGGIFVLNLFFFYAKGGLVQMRKGIVASKYIL